MVNGASTVIARHANISILIALQFFFHDVELTGWPAENLLALPGPFTGISKIPSEL